MTKNCMFCFIDILFVRLLMYYYVRHIVFADYNCSFLNYMYDNFDIQWHIVTKQGSTEW
jgi:hypothetical protein